MAKARQVPKDEDIISKTQKWQKFFFAYWKHLVAGAVVILVISGIVTGYRYYLYKKELNALSLLEEAFIQGHNKKVPKGEIQKLLDEVLEKYSNTSAAVIARFRKASYLTSKGKWAEAKNLYKELLKEEKGKEVRLILLQVIGYCDEAIGNFNDAEKNFKEQLEISPHVLKAYAYMNMGRIYESKGKKEEAIKIYERLLSELPDSGAIEQAKARIMFLKEEIAK